MGLSIFSLATALLASGAVNAFDNSRSDNLAVYYGQNSYGATHGSDTANWQKDLATYCQDDNINAIPLAFLNVFFSTGGLPEINMANTCNNVDDPVFAGTSLANCQFLADDIQTCQARGKIVTLSLGGATGAATFSSDAQAQQFAQTVWNLFFAGSSSTRPFGNAILDGVDLDIEGGGSTGWAAFVTKFRQLAAGGSKPYYVTAAPQCPFPDAFLGPVLNAVAFDAVYVQFYNNFCSLPNYPGSSWNYADWDNWAKTVSPNKNVKIYIGAPASSSAAGSGYVAAAQLVTIANAMKAQYSSFGGVMLWDASQAYANGRFDAAVKSGISGGSGGGPTTTRTTTTTTRTTTTPTTTTRTTTTHTTTTGGGTGCAGVAAWSPTTTYVGGDRASFNGHLWTAQWWSFDDTPGGAAGVWVDNGACFAKGTPQTATVLKIHSVPLSKETPLSAKKAQASFEAASRASAKQAKETGASSKTDASAKNDSSTNDSKKQERRNSRFFRL